MLPSIINTVYITGLTLLVAAPIGIFSAVYLTMYARQGNVLVRLIRLTNKTLAVHLYRLINEGLYTNQAYATAVVLLLFVLVINGISNISAKRISKG